MGGRSVRPVLHLLPEAAVGGPLSAVCIGDLIRLKAPSQRLELLGSETIPAGGGRGAATAGDRLLRLRPALRRPCHEGTRGCDFGFLTDRSLLADELVIPASGEPPPAHELTQSATFSPQVTAA